MHTICVRKHTTMSVNDTLAFLASRQRFGWKLGLDNIQGLLRIVGDPQIRLKCVHVAGTNGKGSTCAILESIMRQAGYKTGLYTSPHLICVSERIRIDSEPISLVDLSRHIANLRPEIEASGSTYFETLTAAAFACFAEEEVDVAIVEVGLGGRYDATNVIKPLLSVITDIDLDHQEQLGNDRKAIAGEKAGIIKAGVPCLLQSAEPEVVQVMQDVVSNRGSLLLRLDEICSVECPQPRAHASEFTLRFAEGDILTGLLLSLPGTIQIKNAALAICATRLLAEDGLNVPQRAIYEGLKRVKWPGRMELIQHPTAILVDVAHNPPAMRHLMNSLHEIYPQHRLRVVVGLLDDKKHAEIAKIISEAADDIYVVTPASDRALDRERLFEIFRKFTDHVSCLSMEEFDLKRLLSTLRNDDLFCVTGSHLVVGAFLKFHRENFSEKP